MSDINSKNRGYCAGRLISMLFAIAISVCSLKEAYGYNVGYIKWSSLTSAVVGQTFYLDSSIYLGSGNWRTLSITYPSCWWARFESNIGTGGIKGTAYSTGTLSFSSSYTYNGRTYSGTKTITIYPAPLGSVSLSLSSSSAKPGDVVTCSLAAYSTYDDSITDGVKSWTISSITNDEISTSGVVTISPAQISRTITVTGYYTYNGTTKSDSKTITVTREPVALESVTLSSPTNTLAPGATMLISMVANSYYDGPLTSGEESWHITCNEFGDSVSSDGVVSIVATNVSRIVQITCDYTYEGITKTGIIELQVLSLCDVPVITPASGTIFETSQQISMTCGSEGSVIHYTTDGSDPTIDSPIYKRFRISGKTTIKAASFNNDGNHSDIATAEYALGQCEAPTISSTYGSTFGTAYGCTKQSVSISYNGTEGTLHYTIDGSDPTAESPTYTGAFEIIDTTTVKAKVISDKWFDSTIITSTFTREWEQVASPVITSVETFNGSKTAVSLSCDTKDATIFYTVDGNEPNAHSSRYSGSFEIGATTTIKAFAVLNEYTDSAIASKTITKVWWIGDSLGLPDHEFITSGDAGWVDDGGAAMKSGIITHSQESVLQTTFVGIGRLTFDLKTSCEEDDPQYMEYDRAEIWIDGTRQAKQDGVHDWSEYSYNLGDGTHTIEWKYVKDALDDSPYPGDDCIWVRNVVWEPVAPTIDDDSSATVTGDSVNGFTIKPSGNNTTITVTIPQGLSAENVTVEVSPTVERLTPNGAKVKIVRSNNDITDYLNIPTADGNGVLDLTQATVKDAIIKEAMDTDQGAIISLNTTSPSLTTPNTRKGLVYKLREGAKLSEMQDGDSTIGDGQPWSPTITVKGGDSAFYSISVEK